MQLFLDFLPVVAFVAAYWLADFRTAVLVIMVAVVVQLGLQWIRTRTINRMALSSAGLVIVFGSVGLIMQNDLIFKWKPTVLNWLFAATFAGSHFLGSKPLVQRLMESVAKDEIRLSARHWRQLNLMWVVFFLFSGAANIVVAYRFPESVWVNFKLFGLLGMTVLFIVLQAIWLGRRSEAPAGDTGGE